MRWCGPVKRGRRPGNNCWNGFDSPAQQNGRRVELIRHLVEDGALQPDDVFAAVNALGSVVIVRRYVVWFEVPVNKRMRVVGISFMQMFRRER